MSFLKTIVTSILLIAFSQADMLAQQAPQMQMNTASEEITDEELLSFVEASDAIQPIQVQVREDIQGAIEEHGFTMERFQEIVMIFQNPEMELSDHVSREEEEALETMESVLMELEMAARDTMIDEISSRGLEVERYQQIYMSLQQDPELMARIQNLTQ